jgi:hypothetical protein
MKENNMTKFKVGQYHTVGGFTVDVVKVKENHPFPLKGLNGNKWTAEGTHTWDESLDLVSESLPEPDTFGTAKPEIEEQDWDYAELYRKEAEFWSKQYGILAVNHDKYFDKLVTAKSLLNDLVADLHKLGYQAPKVEAFLKEK